MAIQISGTDAVDNNRRGIFQKVNPGVYTTTQRDALASKAIGDVIYNSTDEELQVWDGSEWASVGGGGGSFPTPVNQEYILIGNRGLNVSGQFRGLSEYTSVKIAGCGAGGSWGPGGSSSGGKGGGGGACTNIEGVSFPVSGNSIESIYYEVGSTDGNDSFVQINGTGFGGSGGTDLIRFRGGSPSPGDAGGAGGPTSGAGAGALAGAAGGAGAARFQSGSPGGSNANGCAGGGGYGGAGDQEAAAGLGAPGGSSGLTTPLVSRITSNNAGPAPNSWNFGGGGSGSSANGRESGSGAGIRITDPGTAGFDSTCYGGGGGWQPLPDAGSSHGGKGFLIIQLFA